MKIRENAASHTDRGPNDDHGGSAEAYSAGSVTLVGCGPGDPELLTFKAAKAIAAADVLVVDRLVAPEILDHAKPNARIIDAGKKGFGPAHSQASITATLLREAQAGNRVARLKGGDAFVFARAAEEMSALQAAGIAIEIIPGITAAHACAASIHLPMTLRHTVQQLTLITGTSADGELSLDWQALARPGHAFAIYMGMTRAPALQNRLLVAGAAPQTPVVVVENGTRADQISVAATLATLTDAITAHDLKGPAIIFIGLDWAQAGLTRPAAVRVFETDPNTIQTASLEGTGAAPPPIPDVGLSLKPLRSAV